MEVVTSRNRDDELETSNTVSGCDYPELKPYLPKKCTPSLKPYTPWFVFNLQAECGNLITGIGKL